jgi:hypothetical protein
MRRSLSSFIPHRVVDLRGQRAHMRFRWPQFRCELRSGLLRCSGIVRPTSLSSRYETLIEMWDGANPEIFIESPALLPLEDGGRVPHTYAPNQPCMYHPSDWRPDRLIALTVMPWTYRWLYVYEDWRATRDWDAHGVHPIPGSARRVRLPRHRQRHRA